MIYSKAAKRYAKALLKLSQEQGKYINVKVDGPFKSDEYRY